MTTVHPDLGGLAPEVVARLIAYTERTSDAVGVSDDRGNVLYLNEAARRGLGPWAGDERPLTTADLFPDSAFALYFEQIRPAILRGDVWTGFLPVLGGSGSVVEMWATVVGHAEPGGEVAWLVISARDVTEWRHIRDELGRVATHDELTGLAGRVILMDRLDVALARTERTGATVGVLFIDIDDLKVVNDSFGHHAGDLVLVEVASRLRDAVRAIDTVARVGGDEFVVLLDGVTDEAEARELATRVEAALTTTAVEVGATSVNLSASVGLAVGHDQREGDLLLRRADAAMYDVKSDRTRPRHPASRDPFAQRTAGPTAHDVAVAVTQGAIVPHYQSVVDVASGATIGVHALARWCRREGDPVPARVFVPIVDGTGVSFSLDLAMLRGAARDVVGWGSDAPARLYAPVSRRFLTRLGVDRYVGEVAGRARLDTTRLALVVEADLLEQRSAHLEENLWALRELGVRFVLDVVDPDAGLAVVDREELICELRFGLPAIDRLRDRPAHLRRAVARAHYRGWSVQVAGIESVEDLDLLREVGCDRFGGYLVDRPRAARTYRSTAGNAPSRS